MSEVLENAMLSLVERLEKTLPGIEKMAGEHVAAAADNKVSSERLSNQLGKVEPLIGSLQRQADKLQETVRRVGEVKIPEEVKVYNHVKHSVEPAGLKFLWVFFSVSLLLLTGAGVWIYNAVNTRDAAFRTLMNYQSAYKPEQRKWLEGYVDYMIKKHPGETKEYLKNHGHVPDN